VWLREDVLLGVAHRHVVLTIPRLLRPLFRRRRELLGELARAGAEAVKELVRQDSGGGDARPGIVVSIATAGDLLQSHSHLHLITTDGGRSADGSRHATGQWDAERLTRLFRGRLLGSLLDKRPSPSRPAGVSLPLSDEPRPGPNPRGECAGAPQAGPG
jgi:hypothetical protein